MMDGCAPQQVNCTNLKNHAGAQPPLFLFIIHQNSHFARLRLLHTEIYSLPASFSRRDVPEDGICSLQDPDIPSFRQILWSAQCRILILLFVCFPFIRNEFRSRDPIFAFPFSPSLKAFLSLPLDICKRLHTQRPLLQNPTFSFWPFSFPIASAFSSKGAQNLGEGS
jgi:hypothetical protein